MGLAGEPLIRGWRSRRKSRILARGADVRAEDMNDGSRLGARPAREAAAVEGRRPYEAPRLTPLGELAELTLGGQTAGNDELVNGSQN